MDRQTDPPCRPLHLPSLRKNYGLNQLRYDLRKLKGHGLLQRDGSRYAYRLTQKGVQVALLFLFFHKRLCLIGYLGRERHMEQSVRAFPLGITENVAAFRLLVSGRDPIIEEAIDEHGKRRLAARHSIFGRAVDDRVTNRYTGHRAVLQLFYGGVRREAWINVPGRRHDDCCERAVERAGGPWGDACRLDGAIEAAVKMAELVDEYAQDAGSAGQRPSVNCCARIACSPPTA